MFHVFNVFSKVFFPKKTPVSRIRHGLLRRTQAPRQLLHTSPPHRRFSAASPSFVFGKTCLKNAQGCK